MLDRRALLKFFPLAALLERLYRAFSTKPDVVKKPTAEDVERWMAYFAAREKIGEPFGDPLRFCYPNFEQMTRDELLDALRNELKDVFMLERHASRAYAWMTNDVISKAHTLPASVIAFAEGVRDEEIEAAIKDAAGESW
jgi:hypothetical protein